MYTTTKEMRLQAFMNTAREIKSGQSLGLTLDNFMVLVENIQFKYNYTDEELKPIRELIYPAKADPSQPAT